MENKKRARLVIGCPGYSWHIDRYRLGGFLEGRRLTVKGKKAVNIHLSYSNIFLKTIYVCIDETWNRKDIERLVWKITRLFQRVGYFYPEDLPIMMSSCDIDWITDPDFEAEWTLIPEYPKA